jgi:tetratricopeptide (TPR) repeat protein
MLTVFCRYIGMILWPFALSAAYEPAIHRTINPSVIGAIILLSGVCIVSARLFKHDRKVGFWAVIFFVGLLPVSQIIPLVTLMNDRYLYFPMLGASALIGYSTMFFGEKLSPRYKQLLRIFLVLLLILLSTVSFRRVAVWHDDISVGRDTVTKSPTQHSIWEGLGEAYYFAKPQQPLEALNAFTRALELDPTNKLTLYNLGVLYLERGDYDSSYELLNKLVYFYPDHAVGWACLGDIYAYRENYLEAEKTYLQALALKPDTERAIVGLKNLAIIRGPFNTLR